MERKKIKLVGAGTLGTAYLSDSIGCNSGMLCPDHTPHHPDPYSLDEAFAFAYG
jgi:hypothetical protein